MRMDVGKGEEEEGRGVREVDDCPAKPSEGPDGALAAPAGGGEGGGWETGENLRRGTGSVQIYPEQRRRRAGPVATGQNSGDPTTMRPDDNEDQRRSDDEVVASLQWVRRSDLGI